MSMIWSVFFNMFWSNKPVKKKNPDVPDISEVSRRQSIIKDHLISFLKNDEPMIIKKVLTKALQMLYSYSLS